MGRQGGPRVPGVARFLFPAVAVAGILLLLGPGCGGKDVKPTPPPPAPPAAPSAGPKVAVAPMENRSNDLSSSDIIRDAFVEGVARKGFAVVPVDESDRLLRETLGISYGGQLPTTTPEEVCKALGVEGVFYGEVEEFSKTTSGIYNSVEVAASFKLYRKDGALVWEGGDRQSYQDMPRGGSNMGGLGAEIIGKAVGNLLLNPMTPFGRRVGANAAAKLGSGALDNPAK